MIKLVLIIFLCILLYMIWQFFVKNKLNPNSEFKHIHSLDQGSIEDELPEKTKVIKKSIEAKQALKAHQVLEAQPLDSIQDNLVQKHPIVSDIAKTDELNVEIEQEQRIFDDVANFLFERKIKSKNIQSAEGIQKEFLNKMPMQTQSQIGEFDLGEWCIYWNYHLQSLEYYVSKYGIFYTHVDRDGIEHKAEFKEQY